MSKNLKAKSRPQSDPYEIFVAPGFEWRVLKHYQSVEAEAKNPYAVVFLATKGPGTFGDFELGDGYYHDVMKHSVQIKGERFPFPVLKVPQI